MSLIVFFTLARLLDPRDIGALSILMSIILIVQVGVEASLAEFLVQDRRRDPQQVNSIFWGQLLLSTGAAVIMSVTSPLWALRLIGHPDSVPMTVAMSAILVLSSLGRVPDAMLRADLLYKPIALRSIVSTLLGGSVGIGLAVNGFGLWSLIAKQLVEAGVEALISFRVSSWTPSAPSLQRLGEPLRYGAGLSGNYLVGIANSRIDLFIIGGLLGPTVLGYYTVGTRLYQTVYDLCAGVVTQISVSLFAKVRGDVIETRLLQKRVIKLVTLASFPAYTLMITLGPSALLWVAGDKWSSSIPLLQILCFAGPIAVVSSFNSAVLVANNKTVKQFKISLASLLVSIPMFIGASHFSVKLVAVAVVVRTLFTTVIGGRAVKMITGTPWRVLFTVSLPQIIASFLGGIVSIVALLTTKSQNQIVQLPLAALASLVTIACSVVLLDKPARRTLFENFNLRHNRS
jgi:PST family polysaccharide transporter